MPENSSVLIVNLLATRPGPASFASISKKRTSVPVPSSFVMSMTTRAWKFVSRISPSFVPVFQ